MAAASTANLPTLLGNKPQVEASVTAIIDSYSSVFQEELQKINDLRKQMEKAVENAQQHVEAESKALKAILTHEGYADKNLLLRREPQTPPAVELDAQKELEKLRKRFDEENSKRQEDLRKKEEELKQREETLKQQEADFKKRQLSLPPAVGPSPSPSGASLCPDSARYSSDSPLEETPREHTRREHSAREHTARRSKSSKKKSKKDSKKSGRLKSSLTAWIGSSQSMPAIPDTRTERPTRAMTSRSKESLTLTPEEALVVRSLALEEDYLRKVSKREIEKLIKDARGDGPTELHPLVQEVLKEGPTKDDTKLKAIATAAASSPAVVSNTALVEYLQRSIEERKKA